MSIRRVFTWMVCYTPRLRDTVVTFFIPEVWAAQREFGEDSILLRFLRMIDWIKQYLGKAKAAIIRR